MRVRITLDSATPQEVYDYTLAFQRTLGLADLPKQITDEPTVRVLGSAMTWTSPALTREHAAALLDEAERLAMGLFDHASCQTAPCSRCARRKEGTPA